MRTSRDMYATKAGRMLVVLLTSTGCAVGSASIYPDGAPSREASDTPEYFMVGTIQPGGALAEPQPDTGCRNPMVDPRDGTRLTLIQSQRGEGRQIGDYRVADGRYGVRAGELLRLDCGTGRAVGVVPAPS